MSKILSKLKEEGLIGIEQLREKREETIKRWEASGLLDGLNGNIKGNAAELFESQLSYIINEENTMTKEENDLLAKWENYGLLEAFNWQDLSPDDINTKKIKCAVLFENAKTELDDDNSVVTDKIEPMVYPIICRVLLKLPVYTNITFQEIISEINECSELLNDLTKYEIHGIDAEGIFVMAMEEIIVKKYNTK